MAAIAEKKPGAFFAPFTLFVLATVIPEVLIGSTPLSRPHTLVFQFPLYGSAAIVARELAIRFHLGRAGLALLGLAYGVTIEGLALQSLFNPHFLSLDISFGRAAGVNWPWALYMVGYHALWSIVIPITVTQLLFPPRAAVSWVGRVGLGGFTGLLLLMVAAFHGLFVKMSAFNAPLSHQLGAAFAVALLVVASLQLPRRESAGGRAPGAVYLPGLLAFLSGLLWLGLYGDIFHHPHLLPAAGSLVAGLVLAILFIGGALHLSRMPWSPGHWFSFAAGGLAANTLFGFVVVTGSLNGSGLDLYGQCALLPLAGAGLAWLGRRTLSPARADTPSAR